MRYGLQHNGKGPYHLIPDNSERSELCGYHHGNISGWCDLEYINGRWHEIDDNSRIEIPDWDLNGTYCKKCIKIATKLEKNESKN